MKKLLLITLILIATTSCGRIKRWTQGFTGNAQEVCYKGVTYLQFVSGSSAAYTIKGDLIPCKE